MATMGEKWRVETTLRVEGEGGGGGGGGGATVTKALAAY